MELAPFEIRERELGRLRGHERAAAERLGAERKEAVLRIAHERHAEPTRGRLQVEATGRKRHADLALTGAFRLDLPARTGRELVARDLESFQDHVRCSV